MSIVNDIVKQQDEKREREVVAWATACGVADGLDTAVKILREAAGTLFARGKDQEARTVRELAEQVDVRRKTAMRAIPNTPDPSPLIS